MDNVLPTLHLTFYLLKIQKCSVQCYHKTPNWVTLPKRLNIYSTVYTAGNSAVFCTDGGYQIILEALNQKESLHLFGVSHLMGSCHKVMSRENIFLL